MRSRTPLIAIGALAAFAVCAVVATAGQQSAQAGPAYKKVGAWGKIGTANGQFGNNAFGLATDKSGSVYVADSDNRRIQRFSASGAFQGKMALGTSDVIPDVAIAPDGTVWATSDTGAQAQQFSKAGASLESIGTSGSALGAAVDSDGNVLVDVHAGNTVKVVRYDKANGYAAGLTLGGLKGTGDVEVSPDGSIYVSDNGSLTVKRFDENGKLLKTIKGGPSAPIGVGVDLDCNIWMTNISQRRVDHYSPSGKLLGSATSGDLIGQDVAVGSKGDLYVFDSGTRSVIRFAVDKSKPAVAAVPGRISVTKGVAKVKYALTGVSCPAEIAATASLTGKGISGKAAVKVKAGKTTVISIPVKAKAGTASATFKIVLKTNGRPTTEVRAVSVNVR